MIIKLEIYNHFNNFKDDFVLIDIGDNNFQHLIKEFYKISNLQNELNDYDYYCPSLKEPKILENSLIGIKNVRKHFNDFKEFLLSKGCKETKIIDFFFSD